MHTGSGRDGHLKHKDGVSWKLWKNYSVQSSKNCFWIRKTQHYQIWPYADNDFLAALVLLLPFWTAAALLTSPWWITANVALLCGIPRSGCSLYAKMLKVGSGESLSHRPLLISISIYCWVKHVSSIFLSSWYFPSDPPSVSESL